MKKYLMLLLTCFCLLKISAQNIGINATGAAPDKSAMLDVSATDKGMLVPRMTSAQRTVIASPAKGLLVFDTDNNSFWFYDGAAWKDLSSGSSAGFWLNNGVNIYSSNTGNVGIGTNNPLTKLTIQTPINTLGFQHTGGADSIVVTEGIGGVSASIGTSTNHAFRLNAGGQGRISIYPAGDVVVGPNSTGPFGKFTVQTLNNSYGISHLGEGGNILATRMGGTSAGIGTFSPTNMRIFANGYSAILIGEATGNVGIGTDNPFDKLTVQTPTSQFGLSHTDGNIILSTYLGGSTGGGWIGTKSNHSLSFFTNNSSAQMTINTLGNVGINYPNPPAFYKLSVNGGAYVNGVFVTADDAELQKDALIQGNLVVNSYLGIGGKPTVPIEVFSAYKQYNPLGSWTRYDNGGFTDSYLCLVAHGMIQAEAYWATSDARIKNIKGASNSMLDLETINSIKIINYTLKDKMKYADKSFKKVIAQQVEKIYPQVVSKTTGFIPNVYQLTDKIEKTTDGYLLSFGKKHNISNTAKKLQILLSEVKGMESFDIISIPSSSQVMIKAAEIKTNNIFVYGEEVDDFRTVDYEGLTTLNISATQEISKQLKKQQKKIDLLQQEIMLLGNEIRLLRQPLNKLSSSKKSGSVKTIVKDKT